MKKKNDMKATRNSAIAALVLATVGLVSSRSFQPGVGSVQAETTQLSVYPVNSRMSFRGRLATGNTPDSTLAIIKTVYDAEKQINSTTSGMLQTGDAVQIGDDVYHVSFTSNQLTDAQIPLRERLAAADIAEDTLVYATMSADIKIVFNSLESSGTTVNDSSKGRIRFLVPAAEETVGDGTIRQHYNLSADGVPDSGGFDFGTGSHVAKIEPENTSLFNCSATSAKDAPVMIGTTPYHEFVCHYSSALGNNDYTFTIKNLINPAPVKVVDKNDPTKVAAGRSIGSMDAYNFRVSQEEISTNTGRYASVRDAITWVGFSNSVKMTVRVMPQLTLQLKGYNEGETVCQYMETDGNSTAYEIDFGSIDNTSFKVMAQNITVKTNAPHGYVITGIADDQMRLNTTEACPANGRGYSYCIPRNPDSIAYGPWQEVDGDESGFGYSLHVISGDSYLNTADKANVEAAFEAYAAAPASDDKKGDVARWRGFADRQNLEDPVQLFNNLRSTNGDNMDICYRIRSAATNVPGNYMSTLTYTITASF